jgi:hypothetical protein
MRLVNKRESYLPVLGATACGLFLLRSQSVQAFCPLAVADPPLPLVRSSETTATVSSCQEPFTSFIPSPSHDLFNNVLSWYQHTLGVPPAWGSESSKPPTKEEINLLREAFAAFYGTGRDVVVAEQLLTQAIQAWQKQPADELAGLYRVRGDCYMALLRPLEAVDDYAASISLLKESPEEGAKADPGELPASQ